MPYSKCPVCGNVSHLTVVDPATWYAERFPEVAPGGMVAAPCFHCSINLEIGDTVEIYRNFTELPAWATAVHSARFVRLPPPITVPSITLTSRVARTHFLFEVNYAIFEKTETPTKPR